MDKLFKIGDKLEGFCNGYFGSSDYDTKICVFVTPRYAVFQYLDGDKKGNAVVLNNPGRLSEGLVEIWKSNN